MSPPERTNRGTRPVTAHRARWTRARATRCRPSRREASARRSCPCRSRSRATRWLRRSAPRRSDHSASRSPQAALDDLRRRIAATRWPDRETSDPTQGVRLDDDAGAGRLLGDRLRLAHVRGPLRGLPALRHRDRRRRHPLHPRPLEARGRPAPDRDPRLARLDDRAAQDHRAADRSDRSRRERGGRLRPRHPVAAGPRVLRQADRDRLGPDPHRARVGRADAAPRLRRGSWPRAATGGTPSPSRWRCCRRRRSCSASTPTCRRRCRPRSRRRSPIGSPAPAGLSADETEGLRDPRPLLQDRRRLRATRWRSARRRCTGSRIRRSGSLPGCSITTSPATS